MLWSVVLNVVGCELVGGGVAVVRMGVLKLRALATECNIVMRY